MPLNIVFLKPQNRSRLKPFFLKHYCRRQGLWEQFCLSESWGHVVTATLSIWPNCSHRCASPKKASMSMRAVLILKHVATNCPWEWNSEPIFGKGMRRSTFQWKKGVFSEKGGGISVNQGFGKDFYRKSNSVKSFGPFTELPDSENWKVAASSPARKSALRMNWFKHVAI